MSEPCSRRFVVDFPADYWERFEKVRERVDAGTPITLIQLARMLGLEPEFLAYFGPVAYALVFALQQPIDAEHPVSDKPFEYH